MGAGRKTRALPLKEKSEVRWTVNMSAPARNLTKDKLGAVIFGCKNHTISECLNKEIFGLPAAHYSYVKNVTPGLTLFLFNYSDRKLHGIFEAVSSGQMNINPHAWITSEGAENTPYPAQVRVREQRKCRPLHEEEFKPIIAKNYYAERLFWFELDKEQNKKLMELFLSSPLPERMRRPSNAAWQNYMFDVLSSSNVNETAEEEFKNLDSEEYSGMADMRLKEDERSYASIANRDAFAQEKKWTDLFKPSSSCFDMECKSASCSHERSEPPPEPCPDAANTESDSYVAECWEDSAFMDNDVKEIHENKVACLQYHDRDNDWPDLRDMPASENSTFLDEEDGKLKPSEFDSVLAKEPGEALIDTKEKVKSGIAFAPVENCERDQDQPNLTDRAYQEDSNTMSGGVLMGIQSFDFRTFLNGEGGKLKPSEFDPVLAKEPGEALINTKEKVKSGIAFAPVENCERDQDQPNLTDRAYQEDSNTMSGGVLMGIQSFDFRTFLNGEGGKLKPSEFDPVLAKEPGEALINTKEKVKSGIALVPVENCVRDHDQPNLIDTALQEDSNSMSGGVLMGIQSSDFQYVIVKLMQEIEALKVSHLKQRQKIEILELELVRSKLEIDQLTKRCHKLESMPSSTMDHSNIEDCASPNFRAEESVLIVGGFDGCSWLPDLSSYSPSQDHVISLCPMTFSRSYASVAKLNGELYIFGGVHDGIWYDTVESYNPINNQWIQRPSLNKKKGSLAGASVHEKMFAIGGGNGVECFSEVELFDLNIGSWISTQSMLEKRFAPAAAAINGALYVAGGYDGRDYLRSVERFDPREHAWTSLGGMNTKRGCHSLVAFKEKIYALGGYNGDTMVSTVEVFDPRIGSWMMDEPMTISRGYFGSFVLGGQIYVIGGVQDGKVLDMIECYKEDSGWQVTGTTSLGKRSFFSALVL